VSQSPQPPHHTDACIRDAARFGFCEHTTLPRTPRPAQPAAPTPAPALRRWTGLRQQLAAWVAFLALLGTFVWLLPRVGWAALVVEFVLGLGWLGLFVLGLPTALTADLSKVLPPDTRARLDAPATRSSRSSRSSHRRRLFRR
jgi:hypothetical protein